MHPPLFARLLARSRVLQAGLAMALALTGIVPAWSDIPTNDGRETKGVLIHLDQAGKIVVLAALPGEVENASLSGLFIWPVGEAEERWAVVSPGWKMPLPEEFAAPGQSLATARSLGKQDGASSGETAQLTFQLEQISPDTSTRNAGVYPLTPAADGRLLNPRPTFRRSPLEKEPRFPAAGAMLTSENLMLLIPLAAGKDRVTWTDLKDLPAEIKDGLPAGRYGFVPQQGQDGN